MRQCKLQKQNQFTTAWIDVKLSDQGRFVDLKTDDGLDKNWRILTVGDREFSKAWISARGKDHKNMKKMTDIPKGSIFKKV